MLLQLKLIKPKEALVGESKLISQIILEKIELDTNQRAKCDNEHKSEIRLASTPCSSPNVYMYNRNTNALSLFSFGSVTSFIAALYNRLF